MGTRRYARELAMQALFSMDMNNVFSPEMLAEYGRSFLPNKKVGPYFQRMTEGVVQYKDHIDKVIEKYSSNWKVRRMACVDRNILRLAVFELLYCDDIPAKVSINEAIDIAKKRHPRQHSCGPGQAGAANHRIAGAGGQSGGNGK
jgi:transcription antitermination protein NusB